MEALRSRPRSGMVYPADRRKAEDGATVETFQYTIDADLDVLL